MKNLIGKIIKLPVTLLTLHLLLSTGFSASADIPTNHITDIKVNESKEELSILFDFSGNKIKKNNPLFYKKSIQFDMEDASIQTKRTIPVRNDLLKEIQVYSFSPSVVRTRLYLAKEGLDLTNGFHMEEKENSLLITINREKAGLLKTKIIKPIQSLDKKILNLIARSEEITKSEEIESKEYLAEKSEIIKSNEIENQDNTVENSEIVQLSEIENNDNNMEENESALSEGNQENLPSTKITDSPLSPQFPPDPSFNKPSFGSDEAAKVPASILEGGVGDVLPSFMKMGGALLIVLALIFFSAAGARKVLSKNNALLGSNKLIKILATGHVGVKKNILLVEVAGEMLVLGVSNDNITMLTKVEGDERANLTRKANSTEKQTPSSLFSLKSYFSGKREDKKQFSEIIDKVTDKKPANNVKNKEFDIPRNELIANVAKSIRKQTEILKNG